MAPESNASIPAATQSATNEREIGKSIAVPAPEAASAVTVETSPGGNLTLGFDPSTAEPFREGTDLVMQTPDGGRVVMSEFFAVGENPLPTFTLPDGTVVDAAALLEDSGIDMETAAGPGGGGGEGGGTSYDDDPGALLAGVDKLGKLGTFWWDRGTEPDEDDEGRDPVGGSFTFELSDGSDLPVDGNLALANFMYEDGYRNQHLAGGRDGDPAWGEMVINTSFKNGTFIDGKISISGFPVGTEIQVRDADGKVVETFTITEENQSIQIAPDAFNGRDGIGTPDGVFIMPPENADGDMHLSFTADLKNSAGSTGTASGTVVFEVDSAADRPEIVGDVEVDAAHEGSIIRSADGKYTDTDGDDTTDPGWHQTTITVDSKLPQTLGIPVEANLTFGDFADGSEKHYAIVRQPDGGGVTWKCTSPDGAEYTDTFVVYQDAKGLYMTGGSGERVDIPAGQIEPGTYYRIPVDNVGDGISYATGPDGKKTPTTEVKVSVVLEATGTPEDLAGFDQEISVGGMAYETPDGKDGERYLDNNISFNMAEGFVPPLNPLNSTLVLKTGWASEGNNDASHLKAADSENYDSDVHGTATPGTTSEDGTDKNLGAPMSIDLSNTGGGDDEYITSVVFTFDPASGSLELTSADGTLTSAVDPVTGMITYTYTTTAPDVTSIDNILFVPTPGSQSDADVPIDFAVHVINDNKITGTYKGETIVAIDAVANMPQDVDVTNLVYSNDGVDSYTAAGWGTDLSFTVSATFTDLVDGSESHFLVVEAKEGWDSTWGDAGPTGYFSLNVDSIIADALQAKADGTYNPAGYTDKGVTVVLGVDSHGNPTAKVTAQATVTTPDKGEKGAFAGDGNDSLQAGGYAAEKVETSDTTKEYDTDNNTAIDLVDVGYKINVIDSTFTDTATIGYEDGLKDPHVNPLAGSPEARADHGVITLSLGSGTHGEHITGATFVFDFEGTLADIGSFWYNDVSYEATAGTGANAGRFVVTIPVEDAGKLQTISVKYVPDQHDDTDLTGMGYSLDVKADASGQTGTHSGFVNNTDEEGRFVVDAVVDTPNVEVAKDGSQVTYANDAGGTEYKAAVPDGKVVLESTVSFNDTDGSETHYILVEYDPAIPVTKIIFDGKEQTLGTPETLSDGKTYYRIAVDPKDDSVQVQVEVTAPSPKTDTAYSLDIGGMAVETGHLKTSAADNTGIETAGNDKDYLNSNNTAINVKPVGFDVAPAEGGKVATSSIYEDENHLQHVGGASTDGQKAGKGLITFTTNETEDEYISRVEMTSAGDLSAIGHLEIVVPAGNVSIPFGTPVTLNGVTYTVEVKTVTVDGKETTTTTVTITNPDNTGVNSIPLKFVPAENSDVDYRFDYKVTTVDPESGHSVTTTNDPKSPSLVSVDAVADKPTMAEDAEAAYKDGKTAAQVGDPVTIKDIALTFNDYADDSESHYLMVENKGTLPDQTITMTGASGLTYSVTIAGGMITHVNGVELDTPKAIVVHKVGPSENNNFSTHPDTSLDNSTYSKDFPDVMDNAGSYYKIEVPNDFLQDVGGQFTTSVQVNLPTGTYDSDSDYDLKVGGMALENHTKETETGSMMNNNAAYDFDTINIKVGVVTSELKVTLESSHVYENAKPEWFAGDSDVGGYAYSDVVSHAYTKVADELVKDAPGTGDTFEKVEHYGAKIGVEGLVEATTDNPGETAHLTFTILPQHGTENTDGVTDWGYITDADGKILAVFNDASYDDDSGTYIVTVDVATNGPLYFVPATNYSSTDLNLTCTATVEDNASGAIEDVAADSTFKDEVIIVDAVAQAPDIDKTEVTSGGLHTPNDEGVHAYIGQKFSLTVTSEFRDFDLSENHFVLVEVTENSALDPAFVTYLKGLGYDVNNSSNLYFMLDDKGDVAKVFYKIPVDLLMEQHATDPSSVSQYISGDFAGDVRNVALTIPLTTEVTDGKELHIQTGAMSVETSLDKEFGSYSDEMGNTVSEKLSKTYENNTAVVLDEVHTLKVSLAGSSHTADKNYTYEDDGMANAHKGETDSTYAPLTLTVTPNDGDTIVDNAVTVTYTGQGDVYYTGGDGPDRLIASGETVTLAMIKDMEFRPASGYYGDADTSVTYTYTVEDGKSGHTVTKNVTQQIRIDAVAQRPEDPEHELADEFDDKASNVVFTEDGSPVTLGNITVTFTDWDGSTDHFVLIEAKGGWELTMSELTGVTKEMIGGKEYFKIPFDGNEGSFVVGGTGDTRSLTLKDVTLTAPTDLYDDMKIAGKTLSGNTGPITYGGMSEDRAGGGEEKTFGNNSAWNLDGNIDVSYSWGDGTGEGFEIKGPLFENDTPFAHEGDMTKAGGQAFYMPESATGRELTITGIPEGVDLYVGDMKLTAGSGGSYTFTWNGTDEVRVIPTEDFKDHDGKTVTLTYTDAAGGSKNFSSDFTVDAVAQQGTIEGYAPQYDDPATALAETAAKPGAPVTIKVDVTLQDLDGSTNHYVLVERQPGWSADPSIETIYVGDKTYYKFPIDQTEIAKHPDGKLSVPVTLITPGADNVGINEHDLHVRVMSQESTLNGNEITSVNNVAYSDGAVVTVVTSEATTVINSVTIAPETGKNYLVENNGTEADAGAKVDVVITRGDLDSVTEITITVNGAGTLSYEGTKIEVTDGKATITADQFSDLFTAINGSAENKSATYTFDWVQDKYNSEDLSITFGLKSTDLASGHVDTADTRTGSVIVDSKAFGPVAGALEYDLATDSITENAHFSISISATFENASNQKEYLLIENKANWNYGSKANADYDKAYDKSNTEYLKISVDDYISEYLKTGEDEFTDPATGITFKVSGTEAAGVTVTATVPMQAPDKLPVHDAGTSFKHGAMAENTDDADKGEGQNKSVANDYSYSFGGDGEPLQLSVVETTGVSLTLLGDAAEDALVQLKFSPEGGYADEELSSLTVKGLDGGSLWYNDGGWKEADPANLDPALAEAGGYYYKPAENFSGDVKLEFEANVVDTASGAGSKKPYEVSVEFTVEAVADGADGVDASPAVVTGSVAEVTITADFTNADNDGSETRYILVAKSDTVDMTLADTANFKLLTGAAIPAGLDSDGYYVIECLNGNKTSDTVELPVTFSPADGQPAGPLAVADIAVKVVTKDGSDFSTPTSEEQTNVSGFSLANPGTVTVSGTVTTATEADGASFTLALALADGMIAGTAVPVIVTIEAPEGSLKIGTFDGVTVSYAGGGAYTVKGTILSGESGATLTLGIADDAVIGNDKTLIVSGIAIDGTIPGISGANLGSGFALTIADDDAAILTAAGMDDATVATFAGMTVEAATDGTHAIVNGSDTVAILGSAGDDTIVGGEGLRLFGGDGTDVLDYSSLSDGLSFILAGDSTVSSDAGWADTFRGFESIVGSDGDDTFVIGTGSGVTAIDGGAGNDTFIFDGDDMPGAFTLNGFEYTNNDSDQIEDVIRIDTMFGGQSIDDVLTGIDPANWDGSTRTLTVTADNGTTLTAKFGEDNESLLLTMKSDADPSDPGKTIEVHANENAFAASGTDFGSEDAARILTEILITNN